MNEIFVFHGQEVRTVTINNEPYFVGKDVADILGYSKSRNAIALHVDEDDALKQGITDNLGRMQETIIINESGLYSLILSSKLPQAKEFKRWVTSEVLPQIRQQGAYVPENLSDEAFIALFTGQKKLKAKQLELLAGQTMAGMYGSGDDRKAKLGKRYAAVQAIINERLKAITYQEAHKRLANEVLAGNLGAGEDRKKNLGTYYQAVQDIINRR